jgi:hypothetical protein
MVKCLICQRDWPRTDCHIIVLTEREKADLLSQGVGPLDEYPYCGPCWKTISNPVTGPALMRGIFEGSLRQLGVPRAEELANKYHAWLVKNAMRPRS